MTAGRTKGGEPLTLPAGYAQLRSRAIFSIAYGLLATPLTAGALTALSLTVRALAPDGVARPTLAWLRMIPHALGFLACAYGVLAANRARTMDADEDDARRGQPWQRWRRFASFAILVNAVALAWLGFQAYMIFDLTTGIR